MDSVRSTSGPAPAASLAPLRQVLLRVRWRLRLQAAVVGAVEGGLAGAVVLLVVTLACRLGWLPAPSLWRAAMVGGALPLAGALVRAARRISLLEVAGRVDHTHALQDRVASALQFAAAPPLPGESELLRELALRDAVAQVPIIQPARAAPWYFPPRLPLLGALLALVGLAALVRVPSPPAPSPVSQPMSQRLQVLQVEPELLAPEREEVARLLAEAERTWDETLREVALEMQRLLEQIERGELTRKEAFDRLAELEQRLMEGRGGVLEALRERLRKAGADLGRDRLAREVGRALEKDDLEKARQELERLARMARERAQLSPQKAQQRQQLAQALRTAAESVQPKDEWQDQTEAERRLRQEQALREEERRLKRHLEQHPNDEEAARRLNRVQRELDRLARERQERAEAQRELERLRRDLDRAAEELERQLQQMTPEQRKALQELARDMDRLQDEIRKLAQQHSGQGLSQARLVLGSLKQVLRRVGRTGTGPGGGPGQGSQGSGGGQQGNNPMKDFLERASGKGGGQDADVLVEGEGQGGQQGQQIMILGEGNTPILLPGLRPPGPMGQGSGRDRPGADGIGREHDPNLLGDPRRLDVRLRSTRVVGKEGAGPTRSETILGSAERGFASAPYRKVYQDYTAVAEEVMSRERVPPGYRFYVKRYFQLIKPRE